MTVITINIIKTVVKTMKTTALICCMIRRGILMMGMEMNTVKLLKEKERKKGKIKNERKKKKKERKGK